MLFRPRLRTLAAVGVGAALAYLWDPDQGPDRRARLGEQLRGLTQGTGADATSPWIDPAAPTPTEVRSAATGGPAVTAEPEEPAVLTTTGVNGS